MWRCRKEEGPPEVAAEAAAAAEFLHRSVSMLVLAAGERALGFFLAAGFGDGFGDVFGAALGDALTFTTGFAVGLAGAFAADLGLVAAAVPFLGDWKVFLECLALCFGEFILALLCSVASFFLSFFVDVLIAFTRSSFIDWLPLFGDTKPTIVDSSQSCPPRATGLGLSFLFFIVLEDGVTMDLATLAADEAFPFAVDEVLD